jgi:hypothetical protein
MLMTGGVVTIDWEQSAQAYSIDQQVSLHKRLIRWHFSIQSGTGANQKTKCVE